MTRHQVKVLEAPVPDHQVVHRVIPKVQAARQVHRVNRSILGQDLVILDPFHVELEVQAF